jgi:hypothetical protein
MLFAFLTSVFSDIEGRPRESAYVSGHNQVALLALLRSVRIAASSRTLQTLKQGSAEC